MAAVATLQPPATKMAEGNADSGDSVESNTDTEEGATPLMYASQQGRDTIVQQMLAAEVGCALARDRTGKTALHYCCEQAGPSTAALLLAAAPSLLDGRDQDGYAPLTLSVISGNRTLVRYLLARGADVNTADTEQHSVVHWATVCGDAASLELVVGAGATVSTPDLHGGYPIHYAAQLCGPQGAAATTCTESANGTASRTVTDRGAGLAVLRTLLAAGASVAVRDHDGRQPLLWAASAGSADAILALVNAGADIEAEDKDGLTALHCAASRGHTDCVETLVSLCGAHVDVIDSNGCTALFYAVTLGHADATRLLLRRGAEPNRQDRKGRTAAHCGAAKGQLETLRILSAHGANLWLRNVRGDFPLHDAVQSGRSDLVRWLLSIKQSSNQTSAADATNNDGRTPLHVAALHNNIEICKILLDARCLLNPTMRTNRHQLLTPLDAALLRGNRGCAKFLQLHGGVPASRLTENLGRLRATGRSPPPKKPESCSPEPSPQDRSSGQMELQSRTIQVHMKDDILQVGAPVVVCHHVTRSAPGSDVDCGQCGQHCCKTSMRRRTQTDIQRWRRRERQAKRREARLRDSTSHSSCSDEDDFQGRSGKGSTQKSTLSDGDSPMRVRKGTSFVQVGDGDLMRYSDGEAVHQNRRRSERATREGSPYRKPRRHEKRSRSSRSIENSDTNYTRHREDTKSTRRKDRDSKESGKEQKLEIEKSHRSEAKSSKDKSRDSSRRRKDKVTELAGPKQSSKTSEQGISIEDDRSKTKNGHSPQRDVEITSTTFLNVEKSSKPGKEFKVNEAEKSMLTKRYSTDAAADSTPVHSVSTKTVVTAVVHRENISSSSASSEEGASEKVNGENEQTQSTSTQDTEGAMDARPGGNVGEGDTVAEKDKAEEQMKEDKGPKRKEGKEHKKKEEKIEHKRKEENSEQKRKDERSEQKRREEKEEHRSKEERTEKNVTEEHIRKEEYEEHKMKKVREEQKERKIEQESTMESESNTQSMESPSQAEENEGAIPVAESPEVDAGVDEQDARNEELEEPVEEAGMSEGSSPRQSQTAQIPRLVYQSPRTKSISKEREVPRHQSDDKEKRLNRAGEVNWANRCGATNFRKEKTNNVRQVKKTVTSRSSYSVSSKKQGKMHSRKEAPAFTIDVDDEFSGRSPNDQLVDSGLEPSPRRETDKEGRSFNQSASLEEENSDQEQRRDFQERTGKYGAQGSGEAQGKTGEEISVTRAVQMSMRKYQLERRIFHELLELKRLQIRAGRANEQVLVKRLVDDYRRAGLIVGLQQFKGTYTFRSFEKYLYEQLRALQATGQHVVPRLQSSDDLERLTAALRRTRVRHGSPPDDPLLCTLSTHRCHHALHAYSGVPCAAYIPRLNHHTIPKEDLENPGAHAHAHATPRNRSNVSFLPLIDGRHTEVGRFSRLVDSSRPVTLQLSHGQEKQVISLPTERLDKHKRYYVTFTIKGGPPASAETNVQEESAEGAPANGEEETANSSRLPESQCIPPKMIRHGKSF